MARWALVALEGVSFPVITLEPVRDEAGAITDFVYRQANAAACTYMGLTADDVLGTSFLGLFPGLKGSDYFAELSDVADTGRSVVLRDVPYGNEQRGGDVLRYTVEITRSHGALVVVFQDVTDELDLIESLRRRAGTDDLTGSTSRAEGLAHLERALGRERRRGDLLGVAYIDVDNLKAVNDHHGHGAGDSLLVALAVRVRASIRDDDLVVRMGGDEFLVVLHGLAGIQDAERVCEKIRAAVRLPIQVNGVDARAAISVGVTLALPGDTAASLIARADAAMYDAKAAGGNRVASA